MADCEICRRREIKFMDQDFDTAVCAECRAELNLTIAMPGALKALFARRWGALPKRGRCDICNDRQIRVHSRELALSTCLTCSERLRRRIRREVVFDPVTGTSEAGAQEHQEQQQQTRGERSQSHTPPQDGSHSTARPPYEVLGVPPSATSDEIKAAYRRLARMYHPDRVADLGPEFGVLAERRMKEINAAYAKLQGGSAR